MDERTLEALKGSIAHWEQVVANPGTTPIGPYECPLCHLFNSGASDGCSGCPVAQFTGKPGCHGTPYNAFRFNRTAETAQAELDFLKSLLPEGESA